MSDQKKRPFHQPNRLPGWPTRAYKFRAYPIGEPPDRMRWVATRMRAVWNRLADLLEQTLLGASSLADDERKALWLRYTVEEKAIAKTAGLPWAAKDEVLEKFVRAKRRAMKAAKRTGEDDAPGRPKPKGDFLEGVMIPCRFPRGVPLADIFAGREAALSLRPVPADTYQHRRDRRRLTRGRFGLDDTRRGRSASYPALEFTVLLHRPIPAGAMVKAAAWVGTCDPLGRWEWALTVTVQVPPGESSPPRPGRAALHVGWQHQADGLNDDVRYAVYVDDAGQEKELLLPLSFRELQQKRHPHTALAASPDQLAHYDYQIDRGVEAAKRAVAALLAPVSLPARLAAVVAQVVKMKAGGLHKLLRRLDDAALAPEAVAVLRAWRAENLWQRSIRAAGWKAWTRNREWRYQNAAKALCQAYGTIALAPLDLVKVARAPEPRREDYASDESDHEALAQRRRSARYRQWSGPGRFRAVLRQQAAKAGTRIVDAVPPATYREILKAQAKAAAARANDASLPPPIDKLRDKFLAPPPTCATCAAAVTRTGARVVTCANGHRVDRRVNAATLLLRALNAKLEEER